MIPAVKPNITRIAELLNLKLLEWKKRYGMAGSVRMPVLLNTKVANKNREPSRENCKLTLLFFD
jgi:hypothetical protein